MRGSRLVMVTVETAGIAAGVPTFFFVVVLGSTGVGEARQSMSGDAGDSKRGEAGESIVGEAGDSTIVNTGEPMVR